MANPTASTTGGLTRRLLAGVALAAFAFAGAHRLSMLMLPDGNVVALLIAAAAAAGVAIVTLRHAIAPMVANQADLQVRYEGGPGRRTARSADGLGNHRAFHEELERQVAAALRYEVPLSLFLIDLDEFKAINDSR
ncbi:MAG: diguanylate cyclase domain-containing protein [Candidatus Limnocylindria bacterium]